jgi:hypothetical protein
VKFTDKELDCLFCCFTIIEGVVDDHDPAVDEFLRRTTRALAFALSVVGVDVIDRKDVNSRHLYSDCSVTVPPLSSADALHFYKPARCACLSVLDFKKENSTIIRTFSLRTGAIGSMAY